MSPSHDFHPVRSLMPTWLVIALISGVVNVLSLAGAIYMLQVFDRVLTSRSVETLVALSILIGSAYFVLAALDVIRSQMLVRIGERMDAELVPRSQRTAMLLAIDGRPAGEALQNVRDVDTIRSFFTGPGPVALLDLAWAPVFLVFVWLLHPTLGAATLASMLFLGIAAVLANRRIGQFEQDVSGHLSARLSELDAGFRNADAVVAMGMSGNAERRFMVRNDAYLGVLGRIGDTSAIQGAFSRFLRMALQTSIVGYGAWLALKGEMTAGAIVAGSIGAIRALTPVEQAISTWRTLAAARLAAARLAIAGDRSKVGSSNVEQQTPASDQPPLKQSERTRIVIPEPRKALVVENLSIVPPGAMRPTLVDVSLVLKTGEAVAVMGHIGAGKSTFARGLVGLWPATAGTVKLDGTPIDRWHRGDRGWWIGYMPQSVAVFPGTIAENIARLNERPPMALVVEAALAAGLHDTVIALAKGYDTELACDGAPLSAGQRQQLALARALYGKPFLLVLDEPNSSLDTTAEARLAEAIAGARGRGAIVVVVTHRRSLIDAVDHVALLDAGRLQTFVSRDEFLSRHLRASRARTQSESIPALQPDRRAGSPS